MKLTLRTCAVVHTHMHACVAHAPCVRSSARGMMTRSRRNAWHGPTTAMARWSSKVTCNMMQCYMSCDTTMLMIHNNYDATTTTTANMRHAMRTHRSCDDMHACRAYTCTAAQFIGLHVDRRTCFPMTTVWERPCGVTHATRPRMHVHRLVHARIARVRTTCMQQATSMPEGFHFVSARGRDGTTIALETE
jgi:hypothetical protein